MPDLIAVRLRAKSPNNLFKLRFGLFPVLAVAAVSLAGCRGVTSDGGNGGGGGGQDQIKQINHIIVLAQENRGFEHYFGAMRQYWAANGYPDQSFDGLPQFNPAAGAPPLLGPPPSNPGCDPTLGPPNDCTINANSLPVESFHMISMCEENPSPSWNESHVDWNLKDPLSPTASLDGFVWTAAHDARNLGFFDTEGKRAMSYYDGTDLPYYYFMATNFGTSDRWFSPVMSRTQPNRMYLLAATSAGLAYPIPPGGAPLATQTIFDLLQAAGVSWKVYVTDLSRAPTPAQDSAINFFTAAAKYPNNIVGVDEYLKDLKDGTLPAVAYIEPGYNSGLDEHPGVDDNVPGANIRVGAKYVSTLINELMQSTSWKDSVFILTFDEFGGFYEHVPPQPEPSPDGIKPMDLLPGPPPNGPDVCAAGTGPTCDFVYSGYRVPLIVVSPFAKKNYVSHTVADSTAWLKLVERRFGLASLTARDAAQMDMTEFFDFTNIPWKTPPTPPDQPITGACYVNQLP
jgi:phospholipase C